MSLKAAYKAGDEFTAISVRDMLLQRGIATMIRKNEIPMYGGLTLINEPWGEVLVEEENLNRAIELTAGFLGTLGELEEAEEE